MRVGIIGGGLGGVALAYYLAMENIADVTLIERKDRVGGAVRSNCYEGSIYENGFGYFSTNDLGLLLLLKDAGLDENIIVGKTLSNEFHIMRGRRFLESPKNQRDLIYSPIISLNSKIRTYNERWVPRREDQKEETVAEFIKRRFGNEFYEFIFSPYYSGIYGNNPEEITMRYGLPKILEIEKQYGSVLKGNKRYANKKEADSLFINQILTYRGGMSKGVADIVDKCSSNVEFVTDAHVEAVQKNNSSFSVSTTKGVYEFDIPVFFVPAYSARNLAKGVSLPLAEMLGGVEYSPVYVMNTFFDETNISRMNRFSSCYLPRLEKRRLNNVFNVTSVFPEVAPNKLLLRSMVFGSRYRHLINFYRDNAQDVLLEDLAEMFDLDKSPETVFDFTWKRAFPKYLAGHGTYIDRMRKEAYKNGMILGGDYMEGELINGIIRQSKDIVHVIKSIKEHGVT